MLEEVRGARRREKKNYTKEVKGRSYDEITKMGGEGSGERSREGREVEDRSWEAAN